MFKFNNGNGAVVCNSCGVIMQTGISFDQYSEKYTGTDLCPVCKLKKIDNFDIICPFLEHLVNKVTFLYIIIVNDKNELIKNYYVYYYVVYCLWHVVLQKRQKRKILQ